MRFFLGVHKFAPNAAVKIEMDWLETREKRWLNMIRYFNRLNSMESHRLPKIVYNWEQSLNSNTWSSDIKFV